MSVHHIGKGHPLTQDLRRSSEAVEDAKLVEDTDMVMAEDTDMVMAENTDMGEDASNTSIEDERIGRSNHLGIECGW